jgi:ParB family chromosome partitioning protein
MKLSKSELEAVIAASTRTFVPFHKLVLSPDRQARPEDAPTGMPLPELAASIHAAGLLHNLVVVRRARGLHEVCAGGRRLSAMALLVADGRWPENQPVPVLVVAPEQALIASLIENVQREAMHPADEFAAFAKLVAEGRPVEDVAAAFGVTPLVVKRRLKLASVSPRLLAEYRAGRIDLDCLMLLASIDDPVRQEELWSQLPEWARNADQLRRLIARGEIESDRDGVARFVTVERYEAAGGALRRDLFSEDAGKAWLLDAALLDRLAVDALQDTARQVQAEGWRWVDVRPRYVHEDYARHGEVRRSHRTPTEDEAARLASLDALLAELHGRMEALADAEGDEEGEEAYAQLETEEEGLQSQRGAIEAALASYAPDWMAWSGCVAFVGLQGTAEVRRGLIRPDDRKAVEAARRAEPESAVGAATSLVREPRTTARPIHSDRLMRRLTAHRVAATQAELLARPDVALAAITAHLAAELLQDRFHAPHGGPEALTLSARDTHGGLQAESEDMAGSAAWTAMEAARAEWGALLPGEGEALLPWALAQDEGSLQRLLAFLVASTVTGVDGVERDCRATDGLARAVGLDMRRWWSASAGSYLSHVSKARIVEVVTEAAGDRDAAPLAALNKAGAVAAAEKALAGKGWLPKCLQTPPEPSPRAESVAET